MQIDELANKVTYIKAKPLSWRRINAVVLAAVGMVLGVALAFLITHDAVVYAVALACLIPAAVLIYTFPFSGVILWLILMPLIPILPYSEMMYWVFYRLLTPFILILAVVFRLIKARDFPPPAIRIGPPELAMGAILLIVPFSILYSQSDPKDSFIRFGDAFLMPFCMYLAIRLLAPREREFSLLQWVALFIVFTQSAFGFLSWFAPQFLPSNLHHLQGARTVGSLMDANLFSAMLIFSAVLLIQGGMQRTSRMARFVFFGASGISAIFVFLSLERAAWLGGVLVTIGLILQFRKFMIKLLMIGLILMIILGTGILSMHISLSVERFSDTGPIYDRLVVFDAMLQMIQQKPVLGWGYNTLDQSIQYFYRRVGEAVISRGIITSHNTYLTIVTELGLVGFILYVFPVVWWFFLSIRARSRMPKEGLWSFSLLTVLWLSMLFDFTVSNFFDMRFFPIGLTHWWMVLGLIANLVHPYLKITQASPAAGEPSPLTE